MKVVIVHDWLVGGGAEQVVLELHRLFPHAPIYTSRCTDEWRKKLDNKVVTGYLQLWPFSVLYKFLPLLRMRWFKSLDLSNYDLVISSSGNGEAKFVRARDSATHICYCHSPPHFYWRKYKEYLKHPSFRPKWLARLGLRLLANPLRKRDYKAAQEVDYFIANSTRIQQDIKKFYGRDSVVIHPPVDTGKFGAKAAKNEKHTPRSGFIVWGRHIPYKRFDIAVLACTQLGLPLTVAGHGPETQKLQKIAGPTIHFVGKVSDEKLVQLANSSEAFIFPTEEDFGISPVEAMAASVPVIAYKAGGALDYVVPGKTGMFFDKQSVGSLVKALQKFSDQTYNSSIIKERAQKFNVQQFRSKILDFIRSHKRNSS